MKNRTELLDVQIAGATDVMFKSQTSTRIDVHFWGGIVGSVRPHLHLPFLMVGSLFGFISLLIVDSCIDIVLK